MVQNKSLHILRQPDGKLYIEDKFNIYTDKAKAEQDCAMHNTLNEAGWIVATFVETSAESSPLLSEADGGLRERTLRQFVRDMKAATELDEAS